MERPGERAVTCLRLKRQNLIGGGTAYDELFRLMSPVPTLYWTRPGDPPSLPYRTEGDDRISNNRLRSDRTIIKGRFCGGNVGYIFADELPLFRAAYKREMSLLTKNDETVLETLRTEGAMSIGIIKEITGLLSKEISASLQKLQKAFIVFEDQVDGEWDRAWYLLEDEFYQMDFTTPTREQALKEIIKRFARLNVFFDEAMVKSFTRLPAREIKGTILSLREEGVLAEGEMGGKKGYIQAADGEEIASCGEEVPDRTYVLDLNDYLVRCREEELKRRFDPSPYKTLHYIMKKGEIIGIVAGRFSFGPNELEDVILNAGEGDRRDFREEIEEAVEKLYDPRVTRLKRYCGERRA